MSVAAGCSWTIALPWVERLEASDVLKNRDHAWAVVVDPPGWLEVASDGPDQGQVSAARLFEDRLELGPAHAPHREIRQLGTGRYSHWQQSLLFATSDNSDPRTNGRRYVVRGRARLVPAWRATLTTTAIVLWCAWIVIAAEVSQRGATTALLLAVAALAWCWQAPGRWWLWLWLAGWVSIVATILWSLRGRSAKRRATGVRERTKRLLLAAWSVAVSLTVAEIGLGLLERRGVWTAGSAVEAARKGARNRLDAGAKPRRTPKVDALMQMLVRAGVEVSEDEVARTVARSALLTLPEEFELERVEIPGAKRAERWHGVLHVYDEHGFRRAEPFQAKVGPRIVVLGDSLTYGVGIEESKTYARRLEAELAELSSVEVLNLGRPGAQSADILRIARRFLPDLQPDLVIYGVCLNDFLPSGTGQYADNQAWQVPLPQSLIDAVHGKSRVAVLTSDGYAALLFRLGVRRGFYADILAQPDGVQARFARDVADLADLALELTGEPLLTMVLDQRPRLGSAGQRIAKRAEQALLDAKAQLIASERYYRTFDGVGFRVSAWEGHPNEVANAIWSRALSDDIATRYLDDGSWRFAANRPASEGSLPR